MSATTLLSAFGNHWLSSLRISQVLSNFVYKS